MRLLLRGLPPGLCALLLLLPATAVAQLKLLEPAQMNAGGNGDRCGEPTPNAPRLQLSPGDTAAIAWQGPAGATYAIAISAGGRRFNTVAEGIRAPAGDTSGKFRVNYTVPDRPCDDCVMRVAQVEGEALVAVACGLFSISERGRNGRGDAGSGGPSTRDAAVADAAMVADAAPDRPDAGTIPGATDASTGRNDSNDGDRTRPDSGARQSLEQVEPMDAPEFLMEDRRRATGSETGCQCIGLITSAGGRRSWGSALVLIGSAICLASRRRWR